MQDLNRSIIDTELAIGWTLHSIFALKRTVEDWIAEQELTVDDPEWVNSIFDRISMLMNAEECIDDIFQRKNIEECEDPDLFLMQYYENLLNLERQVARYYECLELNAWLDKPCWKVYQSLYDICSEWEDEIVEPDAQSEYLDDLSERRVTIVDALNDSLHTFPEVYENVSLSAKQRTDLRDFELKLKLILKESKGTRVLAANQLEDLKNATFEYCYCRRRIPDNECKTELSKIFVLLEKQKKLSR